MFDRIRTVGEDFSNPKKATVNLIYDGTGRQYVRLGDKWYLLRFVSDETKNELVSHRRLQIDYLRDLTFLHKDTALHLRQGVTDDTTEFQHMVIFSHVSIAIFLSDTFSLLEGGSLAGSLTLLRSAVEMMIEIQYLKRHPSEVATYNDEIEKHNQQMKKEGKPIERSGTLRSKTGGDLVKALKRSGNLSDFEKALIRTWVLLSGFVAHVTPELHTIAQARSEWVWKHVLEELDQVTKSAIDQIYNVDQALGHIIDQAEELKFKEKLRNLFSYGTSTSPLD